MFLVDPRACRFFSTLILYTRKHSSQLSMEIDPNTVALFTHIHAVDGAKGDAGGKLVSLRDVADAINLSRGICGRRVQLLASFSVWNVINPGRRAVEVIINPVINRALHDRTPAVELNQIVTRLVRIGVARSNGLDALQGFRSHVPFGTAEPLRLLTDGTDTDQSAEDQNLFAEAVAAAELQSKRETDKQRVKREAADLAIKATRFVEVCAEVWQRGQIFHGRMNAMEKLAPSWWADDPRTLTEVNRREYRELAAAFARYGTMRVGMAWRYFCGGAPIKDVKDRVQFIPDIPHIQWTSLDKKPTHFSKHLNALFTDPVFRDWMHDETRLNKVRGDYGQELCAWLGDDSQPEVGGGAQ